MAYRGKDAEIAKAIGDETKHGEQEDCAAAENDDDDGILYVRHFKDDRQQISFEQQQVEADSNYQQAQGLPITQCTEDLV